MRKISFSLVGGGVIGIILSFLFMDYNKTSYTILHQAGIAKRTVHDMDFDFVFNSFFLLLGCTVVIYVVWTFFEKRKDNKFYSEFDDK